MAAQIEVRETKEIIDPPDQGFEEGKEQGNDKNAPFSANGINPGDQDCGYKKIHKEGDADKSFKKGAENEGEQQAD
jgi:hypothetical protein